MSEEKRYDFLEEALRAGQIVTITSTGDVIVTLKGEIEKLPIRGRREVK